ncbi:MAG: hypothetical protein ACLFS1_04560 [Opitutales bacterium]
MGNSGKTIHFGISALTACCLLSACGPDEQGSRSGGPPKTGTTAAPQPSGLAVRSDYYTAAVEAEFEAAGLKAADFRHGQQD